MAYVDCVIGNNCFTRSNETSYVLLDTISITVKGGYNFIDINRKAFKNSVLLFGFDNNMLGMPSSQTIGIMSDIYLTSTGQMSIIGFKYFVNLYTKRTAYFYNQPLTNQFTTNGAYNVTVAVPNLDLTAFAPVIIEIGKLNFPNLFYLNFN